MLLNTIISSVNSKIKSIQEKIQSQFSILENTSNNLYELE